MKRMFFRVITLSLGLTLAVVAYQKAPAKPKPPQKGSIQGTVHMISKDKSEITVRNSQEIDKTVIYSADTKFAKGSSKQNTPDSFGNLKEGYFVNCAGTYQGVKLAATFCYFREKK